jgi:predicted lipid-binding transport protein (Tim44 family)
MLARLVLVCLVVGCAKVSPEDQAIQKAAKAKAETVQTALVKGDFATVADYTHPNVIEKLGGREMMLATLARGVDEMKADGVEFKKVDILDPDVPVKAGKDTYIYVPIELEMAAPGKRIRQRGGLVGVTSDGGKTWTFIDTSPGRDAIKQLIPDLPDAIKFPKRQEPTVLDD